MQQTDNTTGTQRVLSAVVLAIRWLAGRGSAMSRIVLVIVISVLAGAGFAAGLLPPGMGLEATYFSKPNLKSPQTTRIDAVLRFTWPAGAPAAPGLPVGAFSAQWRGYLVPAYSETYTFTLTASGKCRLIVNNTLLVDDTAPHPEQAHTGTVALQAGKLTEITLTTVQGGEAGTLALAWASASQARQTIPTNRLYPPVYAPRQLVYADTPELTTSTLYVTTLDGTPTKLVALGSGDPVFTPDGKRVIFCTTRNLSWSGSLCQVDANGKSVAPLIRTTKEERDPAFSPDGRKLAFACNVTGGWEIWVANANGTRRTQVTKNGFENRHPAFSADGLSLVFQSKRDGTWNLYRVNLDDGNETALTTDGGTDPVFNPGGDRIAFVSTRDGTPDLYQMKTDGSAQERLTNAPGGKSALYFDENGAVLTFTGLDQGKSDLYAVTLADKHVWRLTVAGACYNITSCKERSRLPDFLARWALDEMNGTVAADEGGHFPGTLVGGTTWEVGKRRGALRLNGNGQYVDTKWSLEGLRLPCTFACWVNPAATQCEYADIFGNHEGSTVGVVLQQDGPILNQYGFGYGSTPVGGSAGPLRLTADVWQHVAVVCDGKEVILYLNGQEVARGKGENPITPNPNLGFRLGSGFNGGRFFNGALDDFRIYGCALSADEVQTLMKE